MRNQTAKKVAFTGMLFALAMVLSYVESLLTPLLGLPPGVKPGLANIVVMYALFYLSAGQALLLVLLKAGFALLTRGGVSGALSLAGGALSLAVMALPGLVRKWAGRQKQPWGGPSVFILSVAGALAHNTGQLLVVRLLFGPFSLYYIPVLVVSGVVAGCLTAVSMRALTPALQRVGLARRQ